MSFITMPDGVRLYYAVHGPEGVLPAVFLHGYACTGRDWEPTAEALADAFRTIVVDFRGHGRSDNCQDDCTLAELVSDLRAVLDQLHIDRAVLVGHSMGGMAAMQFALQWPDRVRGIVAAEAFPYLGAVVDVFGAAEDPDNDPYGYGSVFDHHTDLRVIARVRAQMNAGVARLPESLFASLLDFDVRAQLKDMGAPALLLLGGRRWVTPDDLPGVLDRLGYSALAGLHCQIIDSHHFIMLEQPGVVSEAMRAFLHSLPTTGAAG